jgi:magnesium transporter
MITYLYKSLRSQEIKELTDPQRGTWVYVEQPTEQEISDLSKRFELEPGYLEDALDEDEQPRLEREGEQSYIFVRFAYREHNGDIETAPLLIMFDAEHVLTVSPQHLPALDWLTSGKTTFRDLIDFVTIEDELNEFLASLLPTNATLRRLLLGRHIPLFEEDQDIVEDLLLNNEQSIEAIRSNLRSISNIRDAYTAISSNNLNQTITLLTLATILVALPNVFFGMYGMNVKLPYQHAEWAFPAIVIFNLVLIVAIVTFARKKRII